MHSIFHSPNKSTSFSNVVSSGDGPKKKNAKKKDPI